MCIRDSLLLAGVLKDLVVDHRWIMYSLFIGLTLGGVPIVWKLAKPASTTLIVSAIIGCLAMIGLAVLQAYGYVGSGGSNFFMMFLAGLAGASAMILPGLSGGYLLLLMGQYQPILEGVDRFKDALVERDFGLMMEPALGVVLPVGLGVVTGVVVVGNLLQRLLQRYEKATLGILLGLLIGSVFGLAPFQQAVQPSIGDTFKGATVTAESQEEIESDEWPNEFFTPSVGQVVGSIALVALGFAITTGVASFGSGKKQAIASSENSERDSSADKNNKA